MPRGCSVHAGTRTPGNLLKFDEHRPANTDRWFGGVRRLNQAPKASLSHLWHDSTMKLILRLFATVHGVMAVLFACAALILIAIATREAWIATTSGLNRVTAQAIIEAVGLLAAA